MWRSGRRGGSPARPSFFPSSAIAGQALPGAGSSPNTSWNLRTASLLPQT